MSILFGSDDGLVDVERIILSDVWNPPKGSVEGSRDIRWSGRGAGRWAGDISCLSIDHEINKNIFCFINVLALFLQIDPQFKLNQLLSKNRGAG